VNFISKDLGFSLKFFFSLFVLSKHIRSTLKKQMKEKVEADKTEQEMRNLECQIVIQRDQYDLEQEKQKKNQRAKSLIRVTTRNKEVKSIDNICRHTIVFLFHI